MISGPVLPPWLTSESSRPRKLAPGSRATYSIPRARRTSTATSEPHSGADRAGPVSGVDTVPPARSLTGGLCRTSARRLQGLPAELAALTGVEELLEAAEVGPDGVGIVELDDRRRR